MEIKHSKDVLNGFEEQWLLIAWVFGDHTLFQRITKRLSLGCTVTASGQLLRANGEPFVGDPNVTGKHIRSKHSNSSRLRLCIASVINSRNAILKDIVTHCKSSIDNLVLGKEGFCDKPTGTSQCDAFTLGSFMKGLGNVGLWPLPEQLSTLETSAQALADALLVIHFPGYGGSNKKANHTDCCVFAAKFQAMVKNALKHIPELLDPQQQHLDEQSRK